MLLPRYDYRCPRCGFTLETRHPRDAAPAYYHGCEPAPAARPYPQGAGNKMVKVPSAVRSIYKTGGFYSTGG